MEIQPHLPGLHAFLKPADQQGEETADGQVRDPEFTDPAFAEWLRRLRQVGNKAPVAPFTSAHQMSTCRMGRSEEDGVVDDRGKVWGREGLYVADASVFPSASGVNPMITVLAIADWISRGIIEDLK
jgi:choline dehydrogenase-like flavoprotein